MNLGLVISSIVDNKEGKQKFIHYRDSKLTHLLKDSLGGNSKVIFTLKRLVLLQIFLLRICITAKVFRLSNLLKMRSKLKTKQ